MSSWTEIFDLSIIKSGASGPWRINRFQITNDGAKSFNLAQLMSGFSGVGGLRCEWQGSWGKWQIEAMMAQDRRYGRPW